MLLVTDIEWYMGGIESAPIEWGLPDMVEIEGLDCTQPPEILRCDIHDYLEDHYGFWALDFCVKIED